MLFLFQCNEVAGNFCGRAQFAVLWGSKHANYSTFTVELRTVWFF